MKAQKAFLCTLLCLLALFLAACGGRIEVDANGLASWKPMAGAVAYEYTFVNADQIGTPHETTTDTSIQLPLGHCVHVRPVFENGKRGSILVSAFYGTPVGDAAQPWDDGVPPTDDGTPPTDDAFANRIDPDFTLTYDDVTAWDILASIQPDTVQTLPDGTVTFTADTPTGTPIRFTGTGITLQEGEMTFLPGGMLTSLDSVGRICYMDFTETANDAPADNAFDCSGGYTLNGATAVAHADELFFCRASSMHVTLQEGSGTRAPVSTMWTQPNMVHWGASAYNPASFTLSALVVGYDTATYCTPIKQLYLDTYKGQTKIYYEGQRYDASQEVYDFETKNFGFNLVIQPDVLDLAPETDVEAALGGGRYARSAIDDIETDTGKLIVGDLLDADGIPVDKDTAVVTAAHRLQVTIAGVTHLLGLPMAKTAGEDITVLHELDTIVLPPSQGTLHALVVPIVWADQPETATDEVLQFYRAQLGRVADMQGNVTDYAQDEMALSRYFDLASYGKLSITAHMTDWYPAPQDFATMKAEAVTDGSSNLPAEVQQWLYATYPDTDWSQFDGNGDGYFDAMILLNAGRDEDDMYQMVSYEGGLYYSGTTDAPGGTAAQPTINGFTSINIARLEEPGHVLVHEFGHNLGLIDYYDVSYAGCNAIGSYDMQSDNQGDWNAFSKYCMGWLQPTVVQNLESGQWVDITIGSMATTGDAIVIPAAGAHHGGPLGEYMLVDLFTPDGLYAATAESYGLANTVGVRIYHVNATMIDMGKTYNTFGMDSASFLTQAQTNVYNAAGQYYLELLQKGGQNTFTGTCERITVAPADLFYAGDVFDAAQYDQFLQGGRMDSGLEFGYTVTVRSIGTDANGAPCATVRITRR